MIFGLSSCHRLLLFTVYKPHIGICGDSHLTATLFSEPFVHFEATQFPYPSKDALYTTEKSNISSFDN
jgi:hypothetical protein